MDLRELTYFAAIAEHGSLSDAARSLYVSQPALSKYVKQLEAGLGLRLFRREKRQMALTEAGRCYLDYAWRMLALNQEMDSALERFRAPEQRLLRAGMPAFRFGLCVANVLPAFTERFPGTKLQLTEARSEALDEALLRGEIGIAFFHVFRAHPDLAYETIEPDRLYAVRSASSAGTVTLKALARGTLILPPADQRTGQLLRETLGRLGITPEKVIESSNIRASLALAANGHGTAFLSGGLLRRSDTDPRLTLSPVAELDMPFDFCAAWRKDHTLTEAERGLIEMMRKI